MGSSTPVTMREETENLVLSKRKALAGIKRRRTNLNVMTQARINIQNTLSASGTSSDII